MNEKADPDLERQVQLLRDQVARLLTRNLELERQLNALRQSTADFAVEAVAASLVQSVRTANQAMAAEASERQQYMVSELQTTLRALVSRQDDHVVLSLPRAEQPLPPEYLGSLQFTLSQVPTLLTPDREAELTAALEGAQAAILAWDREQGAVAAIDIAAQLTRLLDLRHSADKQEFARAARAFAAAANHFAQTLTHQ